MAKSDLQFAGEFLVEECKLLTTKGLEIDITNLLENINIYEDIYSNAISGDLLFKDTNNLVLNAPIIGEEKLSLKIQTPQQSPKLHNDDETSVIDYVTTPLQVYKINTVAQANDSALLVSVNFTTQESFRNQISRISQSYKRYSAPPSRYPLKPLVPPVSIICFRNSFIFIPFSSTTTPSLSITTVINALSSLERKKQA